MSDLADLFARDPLRLTKDDRAQIIAHFRANRAQFMAGLRTTQVTKEKKPREPKAPKEKVTPGTFNLDDLDI